GVRKASPVPRAPVRGVAVATPDGSRGDVIGAPTRRRGLVEGREDGPSGKIVRALVPLADMFGYATSLRSATQGRASYAMEFAKYHDAPTNVAQAVIEERKSK